MTISNPLNKYHSSTFVHGYNIFVVARFDESKMTRNNSPMDIFYLHKSILVMQLALHMRCSYHYFIYFIQ